VTKLRQGDILLRPFTHGDAPAITAACQDGEIQRWTSVPTPYTEDDARSYIERFPDARAIVHADTGEFFGSVHWRLVDQGNVQMGYWVKPEARGRGIASRALRLLSEWAVAKVPTERVQLLTEPENAASQRVAENAGFRRECVLRSYLVVRGNRRDGVMFSLLAEEL
jgi:RimJ/RimL family protein N-acetyltransferase